MMDLSMSIANMSMTQSLASLQQALSITMIDKAMNQGVSEVSTLLNTMPATNNVVPYSDHLLDTYA